MFFGVDDTYNKYGHCQATVEDDGNKGNKFKYFYFICLIGLLFLLSGLVGHIY